REEWRRGDDARTRMMKGINRFEQTGSRFAQRDVIGLMSVIDNFSRQTLLDYYHKWYRPDLQAVIVIGDVDVDDIEKRIKERFSSIPKVENGAVRESYTVPVNKRPIVGFHTDPESRALSVRMTIKHPHKPVEVRGSYESLYDELLKNIFIDMFKVRCQAAVEGSDSLTRALIPVFGNISYASGTFTTTSLPLNGEKIFDALKAILIEVERVTQHSFDQEELTPSIIRVKKQWETNYTRIKNPKNSDYVSSAIEHFTRGYPLLDIDSYFKLAQDLLDKITLDDINRALPQIVTEENRVIIFAVPESDSTHLPTEDDVLTLMDEIKNSSLDKFILSTDKELSIT
ncbi:MAG: insulinase family protein, partial [Bacteroidales bacterium]|nr:insulinase family protein [Bacteroidales bacterium]